MHEPLLLHLLNLHDNTFLYNHEGLFFFDPFFWLVCVHPNETSACWGHHLMNPSQPLSLTIGTQILLSFFCASFAYCQRLQRLDYFTRALIRLHLRALIGKWSITTSSACTLVPLGRGNRGLQMGLYYAARGRYSLSGNLKGQVAHAERELHDDK